MVHALGEIHRVLDSKGLLVDARPDSRVTAYAELLSPARSRVFGTVNTNPVEKAADVAADRAIARVVRDRLFRSRRRGRFWYRVGFENVAELRRYLAEHQRFVRRARWVVDAQTLTRHADEPFAIRRAVRYEIFEATRPPGC